MSGRSTSRVRLAWIPALLAAMVVPGCALLPRGAPVIHADNSVTHVMTASGGVPILDHYEPGQGVLRQAVVQGPVAPAPAPSVRPDGTVGYDLLALSGGGSLGAFGAGVLCGWSQSGSRPTFHIVTGISTGSLISALAFAGPNFDGQLQQAFTTVETPMIYRRKPYIAVLWSDSLARAEPLDRLIGQYAGPELMAAIAEGHRQGRRLYVGTTHLDHKRLVIWDMGSIAACGHPGAPELFRKILRASSSIPVMFDPVDFRVICDGGEYSELHVDGGTRASVFMRRILIRPLESAQVEAADVDGDLLPTQAAVQHPIVNLQGGEGMRPLRLAGTRLWIVVNGKLRPDPAVVQRRIGTIAADSLQALMSAGFNGDLYRMFLLTSSSGMEYRMIALPQDSPGTPGPADFDREAMIRVFLQGHEMGRKGGPWMPAPRGLDDSELQLADPSFTAAAPALTRDRDETLPIAIPVAPAESRRPVRASWRPSDGMPPDR
ncbi:MAG: patatin-like phospholipase family protein [Isosphaeraceae bacterium]